MTGIIYGSTTGNTESVAKKIAEKIKDADRIDVSDMTTEHIKEYNRLIPGSSTWGFGELQEDWIKKIDILKNTDLSSV